MIAIPAVDLRAGRCVQLVGGSYDHEIISVADPAAAAEKWESEGFEWLHVVDLDAATGRGDNWPSVELILARTRVSVQVGGGVRRTSDARRLLDAGAARVIAGTRAIEDPGWIERLASKNPGKIVVAVDVRDGVVLTRGWQGRSPTPIDKQVELLNHLPLAAILVTAVHREGKLGGPDIPLMRRVASITELQVQAAGGVTSLADMRALADAGASAAIIGMALYTGALAPADINEEFIA